MLLKILTALFAALVMLAGSGCGINKDMTDAQVDKDIATKMAWIDKAAKVASDSGIAFTAELTIGGRPGVGEDLKFYFDTDVTATLRFHGNAAAGRQPE
jgi:hypothetical protein